MSITAGDVIDILILFLLAATIFYAWRLSLYLKIFRDGRSEMEGLIGKLDDAIERAENSVAGMRNVAESAGQKLNDNIKEAKFLGDEMQFMTQAGNNLATRLEKLAEQNRELIEQMEKAGGVGTMGKYKQAAVEEEYDDEAPGGFMVRDRDFEPPQEEEASPENNNLGSQAERELYDALKRKKAGGR